MLASDKAGELDTRGAREPPKAPLLMPRRLIALRIIAAVVFTTVFVTSTTVFIDCQADTLVVYEDVDNPTQYSSREQITSAPFRQTLETIKNTERGVAVFLVRGKPMRMYYMARSFANQDDCPHTRIEIGSDTIIDTAMLDDPSP